MSERISWFVVIFTVINILACMWLLWWTARTPSGTGAAGSDAHPGSGPSQATATTGGVAKTGHVWDGNLEEYNNPLPRWWLGLFIATVLFGAAYLAFYPGLGNFAGVGHWSSVGAYEAQARQQRAEFEASFGSLRDKDLHELAEDRHAMATAKNLFAANCSACHGSDARGARGFPNLTDQDWLWGGDARNVQQTIAGGRHGVMPALGDVLGPDGINEVASYVFSLSGGKAPADWVAGGKARFATLCAACHGPDAKGNVSLGTPNLTDSTWLHGGDFKTITETISKGRDSQMPAHDKLLGDTKVRLLAAYVMSLSDSERHSDIEHAGDDDDTAASAQPATSPVSTSKLTSGLTSGSQTNDRIH